MGIYSHNKSEQLLRWQIEQKKARGEITEPTKNELALEKQKLEQVYSKRLADLEAKFNKLLDEQMLQGYQKIQQQRYEKQRLEEQEQDAELMQQYLRGEL